MGWCCDECHTHTGAAWTASDASPLAPFAFCPDKNTQLKGNIREQLRQSFQHNRTVQTEGGKTLDDNCDLPDGQRVALRHTTADAAFEAASSWQSFVGILDLTRDEVLEQMPPDMLVLLSNCGALQASVVKRLTTQAETRLTDDAMLLDDGDGSDQHLVAGGVNPDEAHRPRPCPLAMSGPLSREALQAARAQCQSVSASYHLAPPRAVNTYLLPPSHVHADSVLAKDRLFALLALPAGADARSGLQPLLGVWGGQSTGRTHPVRALAEPGALVMCPGVHTCSCVLARCAHRVASSGRRPDTGVCCSRGRVSGAAACKRGPAVACE